ncbi:helix-turn-helix domain-containing protein [Trueperella pyogenes]|uniref:helix-turn-helix domain-containing protein n=1 Tax=Trueperella pyogenes TaxID=1661 RepID=UPI003247160D
MSVRKTNEAHQLLTAAEVAQILPDTSEQTVYRWVRDGKLGAIVLPSGRKFFRREDIEAILTPVIFSSESQSSSASVPSPSRSPSDALPGQGALL